MRKLLSVLLILFSSLSACSQVTINYRVTTIAAMKAYTGPADRIHVITTNEDFDLCSTCVANETTVYLGTGGRKWIRTMLGSIAYLSLGNNFTGADTFSILKMKAPKAIAGLDVVYKQHLDTIISAIVAGGLPTQSGQAGKVLATNGTTASWTALAGAGTVTSVNVTGFTGITATGGPITGSGTITLGTNLTGVVRAGSGAFTAGLIDTTDIASFATKVRDLFSITGGTYNKGTGQFTITGGGTGSVTNFSTNDITGFSTNTVTNPSTTPALVHTLINAGAKTVWGNAGATTAAPSYISLDTNFVANFAIKVRSLYSATSPLSYNNSTGAFSMTQAQSGVSGYLSAADWAIFNGKGAGTLTNLSIGSLSPLFTASVATSTTTPAISYALSNAAAFTVFGRGSGTGAPSYVTLDTSYIGLFYAKVRALFSSASPLVYNNGTGVLTLPQATSAANGYLSSGDWTTFNNKGTVSSFTAGAMSPLFTTSVTNPTTTPGLSFSINNTTPFTVFGRATGTGAPTYVSLDTTYITAFATKVRSLFSVTGGTYNPATGEFVMTGGVTNNPTFTGNVAVPTRAAKDSNDFAASTEYVDKATASGVFTYKNVGGGANILKSVTLINDSVKAVFRSLGTLKGLTILYLGDSLIQFAVDLNNGYNSPTLGSLTGGGTGASTSLTNGGVQSNDFAGMITITTGTGSVSTLSLPVTFNTPYTGFTPKVILYAANGAATALPAWANASGTGFTVTTPSSASTSQVYKYNYIVIP